jgi:DNA-binding transcriptional ArsR family regulator
VQDFSAFESCAKKLATLTDASRLHMLDALLDAPELTVSALGSVAGLHITMASHHLSVLLKAGIVTARRSGRFVFYSLHPTVAQYQDGQRRRALHLGGCVVYLDSASVANAPSDMRQD